MSAQKKRLTLSTNSMQDVVAGAGQLREGTASISRSRPMGHISDAYAAPQSARRRARRSYRLAQPSLLFPGIGSALLS